VAEQTRVNGDQADEHAREGGGCCRDDACCGQQGLGRVVGLCCMKCGECGIIRSTCADGADAAYLRALGLRPNQRIRLCRAFGPWIVEVGCNGGPGSRIGLARSLAEQVQVEVNSTGADASSS
jgi:Fe2+ transport system protein FeoA